jgi:hypothetical protein
MPAELDYFLIPPYPQKSGERKVSEKIPEPAFFQLSKRFLDHFGYRFKSLDLLNQDDY